MDVDEAGAVRRGDPHLLGQDRDGLLAEAVLRTGEVDQVRRMDRDRPDIELGDAGPELRQLGGGSVRRRQDVGLSAKTWRARAPMTRARSTALTIPSPSGRCAPSRRPSGRDRPVLFLGDIGGIGTAREGRI